VTESQTPEDHCSASHRKDKRSEIDMARVFAALVRSLEPANRRACCERIVPNAVAERVGDFALVESSQNEIKRF
jgi:hypothetical protein